METLTSDVSDVTALHQYLTLMPWMMTTMVPIIYPVYILVTVRGVTHQLCNMHAGEGRVVFWRGVSTPAKAILSLSFSTFPYFAD